MQSLFSKILERSFRIENPFLWKTKTDVTAALRAAGPRRPGGAHTVSCAHTWETTEENPHCGKCSQCIDRRLAAVAADLEPAHDPEGRYRVSVLTGHFVGVEHQTMAERVVGTAMRVSELADPTRLYTDYGEASRVLRYVGTSAEDAARRVFELYRRHARQVREAMQKGGQRAAVLPGGIPHDCLLAVAPLSLLRLPLAGQGEPLAVTSHPLSTGSKLPRICLAILKELNAAPTALQVIEIAVGIKRSRQAVGPRVQELLHRGLVHYPGGARRRIGYYT